MNVLQELRARRSRIEADKAAVIAAVEARGATTLTPEESNKVNALRDELSQVNERIEELTDQEIRDSHAAAVHRSIGPVKRAYDQVGRTGYEPHTYSPQSSNEGVSFFVDALTRQQGGFEGSERLERHHREVQVDLERRGQRLEQRATTTGSFAGLVVPQYLVDQAALVLRNGRPLAAAMQRMPLPDQGLTFQVPRGTTGASSAVQSAENTTVSSTDEVWSNVTVPVVTIAGQQDVSRQSLERGTPGLDQLIYTDLAGAYLSALDAQVISGTGTGGQMLGILNTSGTFTSTSFGAAVTAANFATKIAGAINAIASAGTAIQPRVIAMHPRRWAWLQGLSDSSGRPLAVAGPVGPYNAAAAITVPGGYSADGPSLGEQGPQFVGVMANGLPVLTDANLPTNVGTNSEDVVLVIDSAQHLLWEDGDGMPKMLRFEQTLANQLTVKMVAYGYSAFTAGRYPGAVARVGGADTTAGQGLIAPTF